MNFSKISDIFNFYESFDIFDQIHMCTVRKCDFDFLTKRFYSVFRKTIFTGQISTFIDW